MCLRIIFETVLVFIFMFSADPHDPTKIVQVFVNFIDNFFSNIHLPSLKNKITETFKKQYLLTQGVRKCFQRYTNFFVNFLINIKDLKFLNLEDILTRLFIQSEILFGRKIKDFNLRLRD